MEPQEFEAENNPIYYRNICSKCDARNDPNWSKVVIRETHCIKTCSIIWPLSMFLKSMECFPSVNMSLSTVLINQGGRACSDLFDTCTSPISILQSCLLGGILCHCKVCQYQLLLGVQRECIHIYSFQCRVSRTNSCLLLQQWPAKQNHISLMTSANAGKLPYKRCLVGCFV